MTTTDNYPAGATHYGAPTSTPTSSALPNSTQTAPNQTLSVLALVLGAVSLVFGQTFFLPVAAIILGFMARTREPATSTMATWGIVLGFVSLFGWVLLGLMAVVFFGPFVLFGAF